MSITKTATKARPNALDKHIGKQINRYRSSKKISQSDLANELGLSFQQIQKYESGSNRVSASNIFYIANALSVPLQDFFCGFGDNDNQTALEPFNPDVTGNMYELLNELNNISSQHKQFQALQFCLQNLKAFKQTQMTK